MIRLCLTFLVINAIKIKSSFAFTSLGERIQVHNEAPGKEKVIQKYKSNSLALAPQQLGEFESLELSFQTDSNIIEQRRVQLHDYVSTSGGKLIPYKKAWDFQKRVLGSHLDRLKNDIGDKKGKVVQSIEMNASLDPSTSTQWAPDIAFINESVDLDFQGDSVIMVQHEPVYTLGTASDPAFIKSQENGVDVVRIERGGEVTYHGPGQLVVYPILDLRGYKQDIHWYMRALEEVVLIALKLAGIENAEREEDVTGVWVKGKKVAAIGVKVRRWVTMHGIGVNVDSRSLKNFEGIVPCGLVGRNVGCINDFLDEPMTIEEFTRFMKEAMEIVFKVKLIDYGARIENLES